MTKYFFIALVLHVALFMNFHGYKVMGDPDAHIAMNIPISYNVIGAEQRVDGMNMVKQEEQVSQPEPEPEPEPEKAPEPEIKSKMTNNKIEEPKKEEKKPEKKPEQKRNPHKPASETQNSNPDDVFRKSGNFTANSDGTYTAISSRGINFEIISQPDPNYPRQAEVIRYSQTVTVEVRFLVGLDGNIEDVQITKSHAKFGFDDEVLKALRRWKFKPIVYNGRKIKVYFNKEFVFTPKS